ncbi:hypothetical protein GA0061105_10814 [Rhizobium aethiopicum]|uniref:Uncharacterized protein n=1 Tax=Rhizobium aethiopicum TaxID=1138170 RepID=A0A1C3Y598_9HYPH|nr:hypothetical protein [Rhizobium aethiopicum]SCB59658.1 hypothetical protein GA0061105_10814 [Rhizobium aethiopicum]
MKNKLTVAVSGFLFVIAFTDQAHAYLDPGTGSMILQVVLGGIAMGFATLSVYYQRLKAFFSGRGKSRKRDVSRKE